MLLKEISDQDAVKALNTPDPVQAQQNRNLTPQQIEKNQADQMAKDRQSTDPLTKRIAAIRAQLAQLLIQQKQQAKAAPTTQPIQTQSSVPPQ